MRTRSEMCVGHGVATVDLLVLEKLPVLSIHVKLVHVEAWWIET